MKKFLCVILCTIIFTINVVFVPYTTPVYAASDVAGDIVKSIGFDTIMKFVKTIYSVGYNIATNGSGDGSAASSSLDSIWGTDSVINDWLQTKLFPFMDANKNIDLTKKDCPITYNNEKQLVEFNPTFTKELTEKVQDSVHALDGYYLFEPPNLNKRDVIPVAQQKYLDHYWKDTAGDKEKRAFIKSTAFETNMATLVDNKACAVFQGLYYQTGNDGPVGVYSSYDIYYIRKSCSGFDSTNYMVIDSSSGNISIYNKENGINKPSDFYIWRIDFPSDSNNQLVAANTNLRGSLGYFKGSMAYCYGSPFRVFYSKEDLLNFWNKGRTYAPKLPSGGLKVPITYIQNNVNLPDLNINLDSLIGKAEADIQADIDLALKNYFDKLLELNNNPSQPTNPTPTPDGGFTDGTTPTPKPDFGDGSDPTDTNDWLKKIYEWLQSFGDTHSKFEKTITDYIEANDGKLDQIIEAINALSDGKTEDEKNGCKYDFTALSEYMSKLWNKSDQKFDKMISLLEENNEYQQELVDRLDTIKKILVTQTILEVFQNRSRETAEKAKEKFPTSVPWDIAMMVNAMAAEPQAPKFSLPIHINSLNIHEEIEVDLTNEEWEKLAKTCRYMLSLLFILFMVQLSRKLFFNGGDD
mgnify:CR=1 FL=1